MVKKELKEKLNEIVDRHKELFTPADKKTELNQLKKSNEAPSLVLNLSNELLDASNEYCQQEGLIEIEGLAEYIDELIDGFVKFCLKKK